MSSDETGLNDRQTAFVAWYVKLLNGYQAAVRAGYTGDRATLDVTSTELLRNPKIRSAIDRALKEAIPTADEVLTRVSQRAHVDITPYLRDDLTLDVKALADAGYGHLVIGVKPGREGPEITLADPQAASKLLARYHQLSTRLSLDVHTEQSLDPGLVESLAQQIAAAAQQIPVTDDTDDT